jgi:hypothetical protein
MNAMLFDQFSNFIARRVVSATSFCAVEGNRVFGRGDVMMES